MHFAVAAWLLSFFFIQFIYGQEITVFYVLCTFCMLCYDQANVGTEKMYTSRDRRQKKKYALANNNNKQWEVQTQEILHIL